MTARRLRSTASSQRHAGNILVHIAFTMVRGRREISPYILLELVLVKRDGTARQSIPYTLPCCNEMTQYQNVQLPVNVMT